MKTKMWSALVALAMLAVPASAEGEETAAADDDEGGGCNNYGVIIIQGIGNSYECNYLVQHCDQGTGAGAGAGAGGPGKNEAGASASAGTECNQENGDDEEPECAEDGSGEAPPVVLTGTSGEVFGTLWAPLASDDPGEDDEECPDEPDDGETGDEAAAQG